MNATNAIKISRTVFAAIYAVITAPGTYVVKAANSSKIFDANLGKDKFIINVKAVAEHNIQNVLDAFNGFSEIAITELNGLTMTANIIVNEGQSPVIPMKNQEVVIIVDYVTARNGAQVLGIKDIHVTAPVKPAKFAFGDESVALATTNKAAEVKTVKVTDAPVEKAPSKKRAQETVKTAADDAEGQDF